MENIMKKVIITGVLGQDGSNLSEFLLRNYEDIVVYGVYKRGSNPNTINIKDVSSHPRFKLVCGDITDQSSLDNLVKSIDPDYFINLAANSFVGTSWDTPEQVFSVNTLGVLKCLEALRKFKKDCRFYSAGSSEEFGRILYIPQDEEHPLIPVSPYAIAKIAARHIVKVYRDSYNMFAIHGTLYNHEGPKRGTEFVTRKITINIARILKEISEGRDPTPFSLGNIYSEKDWSDSRDMVRGIWAMVNQDTPEEYILASGKTRSIKEFVTLSFGFAGLNGEWVNDSNPLEEYYKINVNGNIIKIVTISESLFRPTEVGIQMGDSELARRKLDWSPIIPFETMVKEMIENDIRLIS